MAVTVKITAIYSFQTKPASPNGILMFKDMKIDLSPKGFISNKITNFVNI